MLWVNVALAAVAIGWVVRRLRRVARLFAPEHLAEVARRLYAVSRAGVIWERGEGGELLPPHFRTGAGLNVVYTRQGQGMAVIHHLSLSCREGVLVGARMLVAFMLDVLGVELDRVHVSSPRLVVHLSFRLIGSEQQVFDQRPAPPPDAASAGERLTRVRNRAREVQLVPGV
jgi:hypothetical protein